MGMQKRTRSRVFNVTPLVWLDDDYGNYQIELTVNHGKDDYELGDQFGHLAFFVEDLDRVIADVETRGWWYRRSRPAMSSKYIFVKDPNGYDIEILERSGS